MYVCDVKDVVSQSVNQSVQLLSRVPLFATP